MWGVGRVGGFTDGAPVLCTSGEAEALPRPPHSFTALMYKACEWPVTAMERLSEDIGTKPLTTTLFIAACADVNNLC